MDKEFLHEMNEKDMETLKKIRGILEESGYYETEINLNLKRSDHRVVLTLEAFRHVSSKKEAG